MITRKLGFALILTVLMLAAAADSYAQISNAAVLFLRIAPGARAAGMGEAFVAVADDATTSHWNPAGLGAYPLADGWTVAEVPNSFRPLKAIAAIKQGGASDYTAYEIWAISETKGLLRFDNRRWHNGEIFNTRTDQDIRSIVAGYFKVQDEEILNQMVARVARANARMDREEVLALRDSIVAHIPADYRDSTFLRERLDSLVVAYDQVRIRWDALEEAKKNLANGLKDSVLDRGETDRINVAIERSRTRFIPEEITIPYSVIFDGQPTAIAARSKMLVVGTSDGLFTYDGKSWRTFTEAEGLPSMEIRSLYATGSTFYVGTAKGMVMFSGRDLTPVDKSGTLPEGVVGAIGADSPSRVWAVIDNQLFFFDGSKWSKTRPYTIAVGDTPELIAERFAIYGTAQEKQALIDAIKTLNPNGPTLSSTAALNSPAQGEPLDISQIGNMLADTANQDTTAAPTVADSTMAPTGETAVAEAQPAAPVSAGQVDWSNLPPGDVLYVPYAVEIKGNVNSIEANQNQLYIGTDYGVLYFDGEKWRMPGWQRKQVAVATADTTLVNDRFVGRASAEKQEKYRRALLAVNDMQEGQVVDSGASVLVYNNATASKINLIRQQGTQVYFATEEGLRVLTQGRLQRVDEKDMGNANAIYIDAVEDELWLASDKEIVIKANGRTEFSLMHVNWLPELASDMYYDFLSGVFQVGDFGTAGFNITYLTYGTINRTGTSNQDLGTFESYDVSASGAFGFSMSHRMKFGFGAKIIYSHLSDQGAGSEKGKGTSTGFALDLGLLYLASPRLNFGLAVTNLGPDMAYIDAAQSDPLPRNLALGFAYKLLHSESYTFLVTGEVNKLLVGVDFGEISQELKEAIFNGGAEFTYAKLIAGRFGYIYDQAGKVKTFTLGAGLRPTDWLQADFSYIPSSKDVALANTLRMSLSIMP